MTAHTTSTVQQAALPASLIPDVPFAGETQDVSDRFLVRTLSGVFDESFDLYKRHFKTLVLIAALLFFPAQIVQHAAYNIWLRPMEARLQTPTGEPDLVALLLTLIGGMMIGSPEYGLPGVLSLVVLALVSGPLCVAVSDIYLGRGPTVRESYRRATPCMPQLLLGWALAGLMCFGIAACCGVVAFFVALFIGILLSSMTMGTEFGPVAIVVIWFASLIITYLLTMGMLARYAIFTSPIITLERLSLLGVYDRNQQLVGRLRFRHTWAAAAALPVVVFGLQYLILFSGYATLSAFHLSPLTEFIVNVALTAAVVLFFQPYFVIVITALYYDYRVRGEGLDVVLLAADLAPPAPSHVVAAPPPIILMSATPQLPDASQQDESPQDGSQKDGSQKGESK